MPKQQPAPSSAKPTTGGAADSPVDSRSDEDITEEILSLTKELVRFPTTKEQPAQLRRCADFVKRYFKGTGLIVDEMEREGKPTVLVSFRKTLTPQVLLLGHLDVVEASAGMFTAVERDGRLWGRGTDDMKSQDAALMVLMKHLARRGERRDIMLAFTSDEEIGGKDGARLLVEKGVRPEVVFAPDAGTDMGVVTKEKGILHLKLIFKGKSTHGSRPWLGENAIEKAIDAYQKIKALFPPTTEEDRWKPTVNLGMLRGGEAVNQVPDRAELCLDFRYTGVTSEEEILRKVERIAPVEKEVISRGAPVDPPDDNPWVRRWLSSAKEALGRTLEVQYAHGASDLRHFADVGIPGFLCDIPGEGAHSQEEYTEISGIAPYYRVLEHFVLRHVRKA